MQTFVKAKREMISAKGVFDSIEHEMSLVEAEFARQANSNIQVVSYLGDYLRASGGKRIRPALLILSSYAAGGSGKAENVIRLATVMEMLHTATLVHDDIIDNADLRRNRTSMNARFGNQVAVLMGDWLYMSAFETSLEERSLAVLDILTQLTRKMTEGELIQLTLLGNVEITEEQYFDVLKRKTAYLFSGCCEIGAILAGAPPVVQTGLRDFGMNLGIAFQLADDVFDFEADTKTIGKAAGTDLLEGKLTHPLIKLVEIEPAIRPVLENIMDKGVYADESRKQVNELLTSHGILDLTKRTALEFGEAARKSLEVLPETAYRSALEMIPDYVVRRKK